MRTSAVMASTSRSVSPARNRAAVHAAHAVRTSYHTVHSASRARSSAARCVASARSRSAASRPEVGIVKVNLQKLKAVLGTSLAGGGVGALVSSVAFGFAAILAPDQITLWNFLWGVALTGSFGAFAAGGFATILALSKGGDGVENLSVARSAVLGLLAGGLFPTAAALLTGGLLVPFDLETLTVYGGFFGVLGGGVAAGLVAVAKDAPSQISPPSSPDRGLEPGGPT